MRLNYLLVVSAILYALAGIALLFAPDEILAVVGVPASVAGSWLTQTLGSALFALAMLNWTSRYTLTRGILGRPILMPNITFTAIAFWMALGAYRRDGSTFLLGATILLGALAFAFASRLATGNPQKG